MHGVYACPTLASVNCSFGYPNAKCGARVALAVLDVAEPAAAKAVLNQVMCVVHVHDKPVLIMDRKLLPRLSYWHAVLYSSESYAMYQQTVPSSSPKREPYKNPYFASVASVLASEQCKAYATRACLQ